MGVRTISLDVLAGWLQSTEPPRLIDVLSRAHFERAHLPGAENIPRAELPARALREIALDDAVVVYIAPTGSAARAATPRSSSRSWATGRSTTSRAGWRSGAAMGCRSLSHPAQPGRLEVVLPGSPGLGATRSVPTLGSAVRS